MRVLHLPTAVGGAAWALAQGEKQLGLQSDVLVASHNPHGYGADYDLALERHGRWRKFARLAGAFLRLRGRYDVFHFNFGKSLLHAPDWGLVHAELPFYPARARLFVTYNGCDARQKFPTMRRASVAACHEAACYRGMCNSGRLDEQRRQGIRKMTRYAEHLWALNPDLLHFLPPEKSSFLPYAAVPNLTAETRPVGRRRSLIVVHAPTERVAKGTAHVLRAVESIRRRDPKAIVLRLVEGKSHAEALALYADADLVVDQVLIGWYGVLAVEAMQLGKPVLARISEADLGFVPAAMAADLREAIVAADPGNLEETLARCVEDRAFLARRAAACREYVARWHDASYVAGLTKDAYERASVRAA